MTDTDCGVSIKGVSVLVAVPLRVATKPRTGPLARSPVAPFDEADWVGAACCSVLRRLARAVRVAPALRDDAMAAGRARCVGASTVTAGICVWAWAEPKGAATANVLAAPRKSV
ncbi:hypothetical protein [Bradyrhizobium yuanmingense]|uniref:hypothetical protein n=1 Tax=Bradyrhizobium yuanmingense TaxID=108015 RepID=UPI001FCBC632|nr:hypothetical protein [Bradyrhizobium yuanmingense]